MKHLLKSVLLLCALVAGSGSVWAEDQTISIGVNPTSSTSTSYLTSAQDFSVNGVSFTMNNYNPKSGQIRGNQSSASSNFYLYNTTAIPGTLKSITMTVTSSSGTFVDSKTYINTGNSKISTPTTSGDNPSSASWTSLSGSYFCISMAKGGTSGTCSISGITITYTPASITVPTFSLENGSSVSYGTTVSISQKDSKDIKYTLDGSTPTVSSTAYTAPIEITNDVTIKAIAVDGSDVSAVATASYTIIRPDVPTFSEAAGAVEEGTEVTLTAADGCTVVYAIDDADPIANGTDAASRTKTLTISAAQTVYAVSKDAHGFYSSVASAAYTIAVLNDPTFSVADLSLETNEQKTPVVTTNSKGAVSFVSADDAIATVVDGQIKGVAKGTVIITANLAKDSESLLKAATTTFEVTVTNAPVWETTSAGIDELTNSLIGFDSGSGYNDFTDVTDKSTAVYAGQAYKGDGQTFIQIRSKNSNSGIVTTTSGGKLRKVVIEWNDGTMEGRYVEIYGKSTTYTDATDLFNDSKKGTLLGSIVKGTSTELTVSGDYAFMGIKASDALYMNSVKIYWEGDAVTLSDASNYTPEEKDYAKVTLNRNFVAGWNGIVLPFDITADVKTALGATDVKTLSSAAESAGTVTLTFTDAVLPVAAGTPVMVKLADAQESGDVILNGVALKTTTPTTVEQTAGGSTFTLTGTYNNTDLKTNEAYFVSGDKFYHKAAGVDLTAAPFRAYIVQTGAAPSRVLFNLEGETTGIGEKVAVDSETADAPVYNLAGQRVAQPTRGLYIVNGKKIVVK